MYVHVFGTQKTVEETKLKKKKLSTESNSIVTKKKINKSDFEAIVSVLFVVSAMTVNLTKHTQSEMVVSDKSPDNQRGSLF